MLGTFGSLLPHLKLSKKTSYTIDNWVFKLHYRITFIIFLACTVLVCSRQYIGEHIHCIADKGVPPHVMNTFCFFTTTFTVDPGCHKPTIPDAVKSKWCFYEYSTFEGTEPTLKSLNGLEEVRDLNARLLDTGNLPHPGVGPYGMNSPEEIKRHAYYQWVPFVLFAQALMFYLTHMLWKKLEGGRIKLLAEGLELAAYSLHDKSITVQGKNIPTKEEKHKKIEEIRTAFLDRLYISNTWAMGLIMCECLNLIHIILEVYWTNLFLGNQFYSLGSDIVKEGLDSSVDPLDEVFPKVTKCTFHKYGPSGSIQWHDAMCIMALNVVNEKIYTFLWFWFLFLFVSSCLGLLWRLATVILHARSKLFNKIAFAGVCPGKLNPWDALTVSRHRSYTDWLFLNYLAQNMDGMVFREIIIGIAEDINQQNPTFPEKQSLIYNEERAPPNEYKLE